MKALFLFTLILVPFFITAQNIEFTKVLDDNVQIKEYDFGGQDAYIRYQKVAHDKVLRFEDLKLQLYDENFDRLWELNLERLKGGTKDYNKFATTFDVDFIYIFQYNITLVRPSGNSVKSQIHKLDYNGNIVKSIDFHELEKLEYVKDMFIIDEELFVFWSRSPYGLKPNGLTYHYDNHNYITKLDKELVQIGEKLELPNKFQDFDQTGLWRHVENTSYPLIFKRFYYVDKKGKYRSSKGSTNERWIEYIEVSESFETLNYKNYKVESDKDQIAYLNGSCKYDTSGFHIEFEGNKKHLGNLTQRYPFDLSMPSANLFIYKGEKKSENLYDALIRLIDTKLKYVDYIEISHMIYDPINNSVNLVVHFFEGYPPTFLFTFNENLEVISIIEYAESGKLGGRYEFGNSYSFNYGCSKYKTTWGDIGANHKMNALEYSTQLGVKSHVTILNYTDYQILILDNKRKKTCTAYKIVG